MRIYRPLRNAIAACAVVRPAPQIETLRAATAGSLMATSAMLPFLPPPTQQLSAPARAGGGRYPAFLDPLRRFAQGAGSAFLVYTGAESFSNRGSGELTLSDISSVDGALKALLQSDFSGPALVGAAVLLFLTAGHSLARFIGFAIAALFLFMYVQGLGADDLWKLVENFAQRLAAAAHAFQTADVS